MEKMKPARKEADDVFVSAQLGWKYHHTGIPTQEHFKNERYIPHLRLYVSGFETSPFGIEWMRFEKNCQLPDIVKEIPHVAFEVENLEEAIKASDCKIIVLPNSPSADIRVAMIEHNNAPVELIEFKAKNLKQSNP